MTGYRSSFDGYTPERFAEETLGAVDAAERKGYEVYGVFPDTVFDFLKRGGEVYGLEEVRRRLEDGFEGSAVVMFYPAGEKPSNDLGPSRAVGRALYDRDDGSAIVHLEPEPTQLE